LASSENWPYPPPSNGVPQRSLSFPGKIRSPHLCRKHSETRGERVRQKVPRKSDQTAYPGGLGTHSRTGFSRGSDPGAAVPRVRFVPRTLPETPENTRESQVLRGPAALRHLPGTLRKHWGILGFGGTSGEPRSRGGGMASLRRSGKHWGILGFKATRCFASTAKLAIPPPNTDSFAGGTHRKHCGTLGFKATRFSCVHRKLAIPPGGP
jgi:hypothetical protein